MVVADTGNELDVLPVMKESLGDQPKFCDNQWLRLTPRFSSKPMGWRPFAATRRSYSQRSNQPPLMGHGLFMHFIPGKL